jgi:hypothetical protein
VKFSGFTVICCCLSSVFCDNNWLPRIPNFSYHRYTHEESLKLEVLFLQMCGQCWWMTILSSWKQQTRLSSWITWSCLHESSRQDFLSESHDLVLSSKIVLARYSGLSTQISFFNIWWELSLFLGVIVCVVNQASNRCLTIYYWSNRENNWGINFSMMMKVFRELT